MAGKRRERGPRRADVSRRDFLRAGSLSVVGLTVSEQTTWAQQGAARRSVVLLLMTGGPSQLETFDPKPAAPAEIRGPMRAISTAVPGVQISESLPRLAERMNSCTLIRSLFHDAAPIHETGLQLLQTGRLARGGDRFPSLGSIVSNQWGSRGEAPAYVVTPSLLAETGVNADRGQGAGSLGGDFQPVVCGVNGAASSTASYGDDDDPEAARRLYGDSHFGRLCWKARQLVEQGVRVVTVNLFDSLAAHPTWDCHGRTSHGSSTLYDYRDTLCPQFDRAVAGLLDDLRQRGLWDDTLVVATGEFGRTPRVNDRAGRDHWPGCWSGLLAGGGIRGGEVIGASDAHAAAPIDRPVHLSELAATMSQFLGIETGTPANQNGHANPPSIPSAPIAELCG